MQGLLQLAVIRTPRPIHIRRLLTPAQRTPSVPARKRRKPKPRPAKAIDPRHA